MSVVLHHVRLTNAMDRDYDIFEKLPDESVVWRTSVHGTQNLACELERVGEKTTNECFAINIDTKEVLGRINVPPKTAEST
jgi:hypothetical protein